MAAKGLDVALGQTHHVLVEIGPTGLADRRDDGARGDRAEQLARVAGGLHRERDGAQSRDGGLDLVGVLEVADLLGVAGATDVVGLLLRAAGRDDRQATRQQEVAAVAVLDLDGLADGTEVVYVGSQNELHCFASSVLRSAVTATRR